MKIYVYDYTDKYGKQHYRVCEISDEDAEKWVNNDYERRLANASDKKSVEKRTVQQIQDEVDRDYINSDRRAIAHEIRFPTVFDDEENELNAIERIVDNGNTPMEQYERGIETQELKQRIQKALEMLTEKQRRRVIMRYVEKKTLQEIAEIENCDITTIRESIDAAIKKIKKIFENTPKNGYYFRKYSVDDDYYS